MSEGKPTRVARWAPQTLPVRVALWIAFIVFSLLLIGLVARGVITGLVRGADRPSENSPANR